MELETPKLLTFIQHHFLDEVFSLLEGRSGARKQSRKVHPGGWTEPEPDVSVCHYSLGGWWGGAETAEAAWELQEQIIPKLCSCLGGRDEQ